MSLTRSILPDSCCCCFLASEDLIELVYPPEHETPQDRELREEQIMELLPPNGFTDKPYRKKSQSVMRDLMKKGHFSAVASLMQSKRTLFLWDQSDFAYSHAALAQLVKKTDRSKQDMMAVAVILIQADWREWLPSKFNNQIQASLDHLKELKRNDQNYKLELKSLAKTFLRNVPDSLLKDYLTKYKNPAIS